MTRDAGATHPIFGFLSAAAALLIFLGSAVAQDSRYTFDIPADNVANALREFAIQADLQLLFDHSQAVQRTTKGVSGTHEIDKALDILLEGTGLDYNRVDRGTVAIFNTGIDGASGNQSGRVEAGASSDRSDAEQSDEPPINSNESAGTGESIDTIVVTAQRREESLQRVPISITAFQADEIEQARIHALDDVAIRTPGFNVGNFSPEAPNLTLRGIGSTDRDAGSDRSVVVFVDETYIGRAGASTFDFFDLERIEVLHGPQGTLYGRNVIGGAINIITRKPQPHTEAYIETGIGNYNLLETRAMFNTPLSDDWSARFAMSTRDRDGFQTNVLTGNDLDTADNASARAHLRYQPSGDTDLLLSGEYSRDRVYGVSRKMAPGGAFTDLLGFTPDPDPRRVEVNDDGRFHRDAYSFTARLDQAVAMGELTVLSSYRDVSSDVVQDVVAIPLESSFDGQGRPLGFLSIDDTDEDYRVFSQEVRLASPISGSPLNWVVGAYYSNEQIDRISIRDRSLLGLTSLPQFDQGNKTTSQALFGQLTYSVTPDLNVTFGARFTKDEKDFRLRVTDESGGQADNLNPATEEFDITASDSWSAFTPRLAVDYAVTEDIMLYASAARGFKGGGFQGFAPDAASAQISFDPEFAWNYEVGLKSQWLDRRLTFNTTAFNIDYTDLQFRHRVLTVPGDESSAVVIILNASDARIQGLESSLSFRPIHNLELSASHAYLDTEIRSFIDDIPDPPDIVGNRLALAPEHSYVLSARYGVPLESGGRVNMRTDYTYKGQHFFEAEQWAAGDEPGYGLLDARISYASADDRWELAAWGKNLTDKVYRSQVQSGVGGTIGVSRFGDPRTYGLSFIWRLN